MNSIEERVQKDNSFFNGMLFALGENIPQEETEDFKEGVKNITERREKKRYGPKLDEEFLKRQILKRFGADDYSKGIIDEKIGLSYRQTGDDYITGYSWALKNRVPEIKIKFF